MKLLNLATYYRHATKIFKIDEPQKKHKRYRMIEEWFLIHFDPVIADFRQDAAAVVG